MNFDGFSIPDALEFVCAFFNCVQLLKLFLFFVVIDGSYNGNHCYCQQNADSLQPESLSFVGKKVLNHNFNYSCDHKNDEHLVTEGAEKDLKK